MVIAIITYDSHTKTSMKFTPIPNMYHYHMTRSGSVLNTETKQYRIGDKPSKYMQSS